MSFSFPPVILGSKSPRRQELLTLLDLDFRVIARDVDESFPDTLDPQDVAPYIARKKAEAFADIDTGQWVITADTVVCIDKKILGKPTDAADAYSMLKTLSGRMHEVYTGVCVRTAGGLTEFCERSEVYFRALTDEQIRYYIANGNPLDKAGAYGIQEWIGLIAIEKIVGSYTNIVGLPTERLFQVLLKSV
ncbi:MAG: septum formation protein Maf [Mucilaginibacter polytrichastri]|nr:septum formation protein Maf [Mucilaginibacter polytrichastri]